MAYKKRRGTKNALNDKALGIILLFAGAAWLLPITYGNFFAGFVVLLIAVLLLLR